MTEASVIDRAALNRMLDLVGNDRDMFCEMMDEFFDDAPHFIAAIRSALDRGTAAEMRVAAHSFKSNSASFGALALAEQCRALEAQAKAGSFDGAAERILAIEEGYARARAELESTSVTE